MGHIIYFSLESFSQSLEISHANGIKQIYMDANGTQICFTDDKSNVYVHDPVMEIIIAVPECPDSVNGIIWDQNLLERNVFAVYNKNTIASYIYIKYHIEG